MTELDDSINAAYQRQRNIEELLAACAIYKPATTVRDCGWLKPDVINHIEIKEFWKKLLASVTPDMENDKAQEIAGRLALESGIYLRSFDWQNQVQIGVSPNMYAQEIARRHYILKQQELSRQLSTALYDFDDITAKTIIEQMSTTDHLGGVELPTAFEAAQEFEKTLRAGDMSISTYIPIIDNATGGMQRKNMVIIAGRSSMGKTALVWQIARNVARHKKVIFFSLEMSRTNVWGARTAGPLAGHEWKKIKAGLSPDEMERLIEISYKESMTFEDRLILINKPHTTDQVWQAVSQYQPDLVVIDHLRLLKDTRGESENKRQGYIAQRLKEIGQHYNCVMVVLHQLSNRVEERQDKRPLLGDLRDSGEIGDIADVVMMLYRDEYYNRETPNKGVTELWLRKDRDGNRDVLINLKYDPRQEWFE